MWKIKYYKHDLCCTDGLDTRTYTHGWHTNLV